MPDNLKPKTYRLNQITINRIKEISEELDIDYQSTIEKILQAYEAQKGKDSLKDPAKKEQIERFEGYINNITKQFLDCMQLLDESDDKAEAKVLYLLKSKDETIVSLQNQLKIEAELKIQNDLKAKKFAEINAELEGQLEAREKLYQAEKEKLASKVVDKDKLINLLEAENENLSKTRAKIEAEYKNAIAALEQLNALKEQCNKLTADKKELEVEIVQLKKSLSEENEEVKRLKEEEESLLQEQKNKYEVIIKEEIDRKEQQYILLREKALIEQEKEFQNILNQTNELHFTEIQKYQSQYYNLMNRIYEKSEIQDENKPLDQI